MEPKTHIVKRRDGAAPEEQVSDKELANMKKVFGRNFSDFDVTPIKEVEKPAKVATEKANTNTPSA